MTDRKIDITRRSVLASVGAVGLAGAGAGLGTSALFSDEESFDGSTMAAGELDLLVDWQQQYQRGSETNFVNAHPDHDGDGVQSLSDDLPDYEESGSRNIVEFLDCETLSENYAEKYGDQGSLVELADVKPGDSGEITFSLHLCDNPGYLWMQAANVSNLENGHTEPERNHSEDPGGPEGELAQNVEVELWYDDDCDNEIDPGASADIMLTLDFSGSMLYDQFGGAVSGDSLDVFGTTYPQTTKIDLVELATRQFVRYLDGTAADVQIGVAYFDGSLEGDPRIGILQPLTDDLGAVDTRLDDLRQKLANVVAGGDPDDGSGDPDPSAGDGIAEGTYIGEGVNVAQAELNDNGRPGVEYDNVVLSDGESFVGQSGTEFISPQDAADDARADLADNPPTDLYGMSIATGSSGDTTLSNMAGPAEGAGGNPAYFFDVDDPADVPTVFGSIADLFAPDEVFFSGTLDEAFAELTTGDGIALDANGLTAFDEVGDPADLDNDEARECFHPAVTTCVGFRWELPASVGNEVQSDRVEFDLGFYAEQCRSNDGTGPVTSD